MSTTSALDGLIASLNTPDREQRLKTTAFIIAMDYPNTIDHLLDAAMSQSAYQRAGALATLALISDERGGVPWHTVSQETYAQIIEDATGERDVDDISESALFCLLEAGASAIEPLKSRLMNYALPQRARMEAAYFLAKIEPEGQDAIWEAFFQVPNSEMPYYLVIVSKLCPNAISRLTSVLTAGDWDQRHRALVALQVLESRSG